MDFGATGMSPTPDAAQSAQRAKYRQTRTLQTGFVLQNHSVGKAWSKPAGIYRAACNLRVGKVNTGSGLPSLALRIIRPGKSIVYGCLTRLHYLFNEETRPMLPDGTYQR